MKYLQGYELQVDDILEFVPDYKKIPSETFETLIMEIYLKRSVWMDKENINSCDIVKIDAGWNNTLHFT